MAFDQWARNTNEKLKFVEAPDGTPAIRVSLKQTTLSENSTMEFYDHRGFLIMSLDEATGDLAIKGSFIKI